MRQSMEQNHNRLPTTVKLFLVGDFLRVTFTDYVGTQSSAILPVLR